MSHQNLSTAQRKAPEPMVVKMVGRRKRRDSAWGGEPDHQNEAVHRPVNPYRLIGDRPKIEALKQPLLELLVLDTGRH
jgi:hypothetical protein